MKSFTSSVKNTISKDTFDIWLIDHIKFWTHKTNTANADLCWTQRMRIQNREEIPTENRNCQKHFTMANSFRFKMILKAFSSWKDKFGVEMICPNPYHFTQIGTFLRLQPVMDHTLFYLGILALSELIDSFGILNKPKCFFCLKSARWYQKKKIILFINGITKSSFRCDSHHTLTNRCWCIGWYWHKMLISYFSANREGYCGM